MDWYRLWDITDRARAAAAAPGWNAARWRELVAEAFDAACGEEEYLHFLSEFAPVDDPGL